MNEKSCSPSRKSDFKGEKNGKEDKVKKNVMSTRGRGCSGQCSSQIDRYLHQILLLPVGHSRTITTPGKVMNDDVGDIDLLPLHPLHGDDDEDDELVVERDDDGKYGRKQKGRSEIKSGRENESVEAREKEKGCDLIPFPFPSSDQETQEKRFVINLTCQCLSRGKIRSLETVPLTGRKKEGKGKSQGGTEITRRTEGTKERIQGESINKKVNLITFLFEFKSKFAFLSLSILQFLSFFALEVRKSHMSLQGSLV